MTPEEVNKDLVEKCLSEIEVVFYRHTEQLACGYMGIRCDENQSGDDNYKVVIKELLTKAIPIMADSIKKELGKLILSDNVEAKSGVINYQDWQAFWEGVKGVK